MVDIWASMCESEPYEVVVSAVKNHIANDTKGFLPVIGAIKEQIYKTSNPDEPTELEAWNSVKKVLGKAYYQTAEMWDKLSPLAQKAVGYPSQLKDWSMVDLDQLNSVIASNFQRSYRVIAERQKEDIKSNPLLTVTKLKEIE